MVKLRTLPCRSDITHHIADTGDSRLSSATHSPGVKTISGYATAQTINADSTADDFPLVDLTGEDDEEETVSVTDSQDGPDPAPPQHTENQVVPTTSSLDQTSEPSDEPLRKKVRESLCPPPPQNSPALSCVSLFPDGPGGSTDDAANWNTPQRAAWVSSSWTSSNAGHTPYPFQSPSEQDIEVQEASPVPSPADTPHTDTPSIETLGQQFSSSHEAINRRLIELSSESRDTNRRLIEQSSELRDANRRLIELSSELRDTRRRLDACGSEVRASRLETRRHDDFIRNMYCEIFRCIHTMKSILDVESDRRGRQLAQYHRELVLMFHHLIHVLIDTMDE
ncbi:uncharacterized protein [Pseudorasbora parva]|uniref:uncharacterized protein n=1 Tax=Pseudorasbora parva TaxID=51549 RepID=UPI00351DCE4D